MSDKTLTAEQVEEIRKEFEFFDKDKNKEV